VAGCGECVDEPSGSCATELVSLSVIALTGETHTIIQIIIKACALKMAEYMLYEQCWMMLSPHS
jgi:hypothetical protein